MISQPQSGTTSKDLSSTVGRTQLTFSINIHKGPDLPIFSHCQSVKTSNDVELCMTGELVLGDGVFETLLEMEIATDTAKKDTL